MMIVDAKGKIAGRVATTVAKKLLAGEQVIVTNVKDVVLSGSLADHVDKMNRRRLQQNKRSPEESVTYPRVPRMLFKRILRGMLPKKSQRGRDALKLLKAYDGAADVEVKDAKEIAFAPSVHVEKATLTKKTTLGDLCRAFGYKG